MSELNEHDAGSRAPFLSFIPRDRDPQNLTSAYIRPCRFLTSGNFICSTWTTGAQMRYHGRADSEALTTPFVAGCFSLAG